MIFNPGNNYREKEMTCGVIEILKIFKFTIHRLSDIFLERPKV